MSNSPFSRLEVLAKQTDKWRLLPGAEKRLLLFAALVALPAAWAGLRLMGLGRIQHWLADHPTPDRGNALEEVERVASLFDLAARHTWVPTTCLTRSLALVWLLRKRGIEVTLRIGVRRVADKIEAHAWTEYLGTRVNDNERISYDFAVFEQPLSPRNFPR